ncbi:MAG: SMC-Scp complex subunit ScpB [Terrimicrobiaceae bacterium]|nr:SMC-Scp complex subunit ScpB [Terrimicrobiaceae bacterium]
MSAETVQSSEEGAEPVAPPAPRLRDVIEAVLFASHKPVSVRELLGVLKSAAQTDSPAARALGKVREEAVREALGELAVECQNAGKVYHLRETAGGWQLVSHPDFFPWLRQLFPESRPARLSPPALETLAIIAYRQPITRADIEAVRGVAVDGVMQTLLDRGLVRIAGRAEVPGRPLLYETTQFFLEHFGIRDLSELPNAAELRRAPLPTAGAQAPQEEAPEQPQLALDPTAQPAAGDGEAGAETGQPAAKAQSPDSEPQ